MGIEDDLIEQERWDRMPTWYKRTHPAPCPDLVREGWGKLTDYGKEKYIEALKKELAEKDAMIDWLAAECARNIPVYFDGFVTKEYWLEAAQEAVRKND